MSTFHAPSPWKLDAGGVVAPSGGFDASSGSNGSALLVGGGSSDAGAWITPRSSMRWTPTAHLPSR